MISKDCRLEQALEAAQKTGLELHIIGKVIDELYFRRCLKSFSRARVYYHGALETEEAQAIVGSAQALVVTSSPEHCFQAEALEALACGTPVICPEDCPAADLIADNETGFVTEDRTTNSYLEAIDLIDMISRAHCRETAEELFSKEALGNKLESLIKSSRVSKISIEKTTSHPKSRKNSKLRLLRN